MCGSGNQKNGAGEVLPAAGTKEAKGKKMGVSLNFEISEVFSKNTLRRLREAGFKIVSLSSTKLPKSAYVQGAGKMGDLWVVGVYRPHDSTPGDWEYVCDILGDFGEDGGRCNPS